MYERELAETLHRLSQAVKENLINLHDRVATLEDKIKELDKPPRQALAQRLKEKCK